MSPRTPKKRKTSVTAIGLLEDRTNTPAPSLRSTTRACGVSYSTTESKSKSKSSTSVQECSSSATRKESKQSSFLDSPPAVVEKQQQQQQPEAEIQGFSTPVNAPSASAFDGSYSSLEGKDFADDIFVSLTVYRKRKQKQQQLLHVSRTCPPLGRPRTRAFSRRIHMEESSLNRSNVSVQLKSPATECLRTLREPHTPKNIQLQQTAGSSEMEKPTLPQSFVQEQKARFAEIDAFELQEEEVSGDAFV